MSRSGPSPGPPPRVPGGQRIAYMRVIAMLRNETDDGAELVTLMLGIARGEVKGAQDVTARMKAADWLWTRLHGKDPSQVIVSGRGLDFSRLSDAQLSAIREVRLLPAGAAPTQEQAQALALLVASNPPEDGDG